MSFREDFIWGLASASYQIEGAVFEDGKGLSVWDVFCRKNGAIFHGHNGDYACDHYHRYKEDVALLKQIGVKAYRFSVSWPRVLPEGEGKVNQKGLDFYNKLVDELLAAGVDPFITLFHWDYPHELLRRGGWLNPKSSEWFEKYTEVLVKTLGDRVKDWITLNEPQVFTDYGHRTGEHAPGLQLQFADVLLAAHNVLLAHGKAVRTIREYGDRDTNIGISPAGGDICIPASNSEVDIDAAKKSMFRVKEKNLFELSWWLDPIVFGRYPEDGLKLFGTDVPEFSDKDLEIISEPIDFMGCNIYRGSYYASDSDGKAELLPLEPGYPMTSQSNWNVSPESMYWGTKFYYERYKLPIIITENGHQNLDYPLLDGKVHDPQRIDYIYRYLRSLKKAISEGVDVRGYFHWTLMDNFEWALGYSVRVGLVYVDFVSQKRVLKDSAKAYQKIIATNGECLDGEFPYTVTIE